MKTRFVENFVRLEREIADQKGQFVLFALFALEDQPNRWDLVFAAPWGTEDDDATAFVIGEIKRVLGPAAFIDLSRVVQVAPGHPDVQEINRTISVEHGTAEIRDTDFSGVSIRHGYIITSRAQPPLAAAK